MVTMNFNHLTLTSVLLLILLAASSGPSLACDSGPDFCTDDPRIGPALAAKKAELLKYYPQRLVDLLDRGVQCVARIERSPDAFSLVIVSKDMTQSVSWSAEDEQLAKDKLGKDVKRFWIVNTRRAFSCDGQPPYNEQADYDSVDDVNASLAIKCEAGGTC